MARRALVVAALAIVGCGRDPAPKVVFEGDAGQVRPEDPLDCRTHLARADTGEVTAKRAVFAEARVDGASVVLHEGAAETWRVPLADGGAPPVRAVVLPRQVVAHDGERAIGLDRKTGQVLWTHAERGASLLALPGDLVLVADAAHAVALGAKKGNEVFRVPLPAPASAPTLADERLVVLVGKGRTVILDPPLATGVLAPSPSRARSRPRYDVPLEALAVVTTRGALGDAFVLTPTRIERVRSEPNEGAPTWSDTLPFADATKLTVLDAEDTLALAGYAGADGARGPIHLRLYDVRGDTLATRFDTSVPRAAEGRTGCTVALGRPAKDLVVAELCAEGSAVTVVDGARGALVRRKDLAFKAAVR